MPSNQSSLTAILPGIRERAASYDISGDWPEEDLHMLGKVGALKWAIPMRLQGHELSPIELHFRYEALASASLSTALILSQRDTAVAYIDSAPQNDLRNAILRELCSGQTYATIGISQLTTSHQSGQPALKYEKMDTGYKLSGLIPWSTGAVQARYIVAGAAHADGSQILFILPTDLAGISIDPPMQLVTLCSSKTSMVRLNNVQLDNQWVLHGPTTDVLSIRRRTLPVGQAFLALGLCRGALDLLEANPSDTGQQFTEIFAQQLEQARQQILDLCEPGKKPADEILASARATCIDLAIRLTHATVALYKGSALRLSHPAQRLARETLFLLVWSCSTSVVGSTLQRLAVSDPLERTVQPALPA